MGGDQTQEENHMKKKAPLLTAGELSLILNISEATVKNLAKSKDLPCVYARRQPKFDFLEVLKHFERLEGGEA